jgi:hypothetical protein
LARNLGENTRLYAAFGTYLAFESLSEENVSLCVAAEYLESSDRLQADCASWRAHMLGQPHLGQANIEEIQKITDWLSDCWQCGADPKLGLNSWLKTTR